MAKNKETTQPEGKTAEPTYEELKREYLVLRAMLEDKHRIEEIERTKVRLTFKFKVLELSNHFPMEYVRDVANDIISEMPAGETLKKMQQEAAAQAAAEQQRQDPQGCLHVVQQENNEQ